MSRNTVLLVEQMLSWPQCGQPCLCAETSRITMKGMAKHLLVDERIQEAYLGGKQA